MFKRPFSFKGRISRREYRISFLINPIVVISYLIISVVYFRTSINIFLIFIPLLAWFNSAQSAKRCHDMGKSGWYQFGYFNFSWFQMMHKEGMDGDNEYGPKP